VPAAFGALGSTRVVHASRYLSKVGALDPRAVASVAVVGGAQSAAEVYDDCLRRFPQARVRLLVRSVGLSPYGGSKFTNALYSDEYVDHFHAAPPAQRQAVLEAMRDSNYAGVTPATLETLYRFHYLQGLDGGDRARIDTQCQIGSVRLDADGAVCIGWRSGPAGVVHEDRFDLVVLGTGYRNETPALLAAALGGREPVVDRHYRARLACEDGCSLHVLGVNEATHGISDTLLSVVGARARRVLADIAGERRRGPPPAQLETRSPSPAPIDSAALAA
jgi:L-ornithine N5-monooxygenase